MERAGRTAVVVAVVMAVLAVATGAVAVVQTVRLRQLTARTEQVERKLALATERLEESGDAAGADGSGGEQDGGGGPLDGLLGDGELGDLLDGLLGDGRQGTAGGLADAAELAACARVPGEQIEVDDSDGQEQFDDIEQAVEDLRDLGFSDDVEPTYLTPQEVTERITETVTEEYSEAEADIDRRLLTALGAIEPDRDLRQTQIDLLGGQVAGFYDSDTGEMVVATTQPGEPLGPVDQVTLAHELTHVLTDQALGLPELLDEETPDSDAALAALALVEGDATLSMQQFAGAALGLGEQLALATDPRAAGAQAQLAEFPYVLQEELAFPYVEGLRFACAVYRNGGWDAVDALYADLPSTSAQVLFPERLAEPAATPPPALQAPGPDWDEVHTDSLGAAELKWLFEAPGDDESDALTEPLERVARWDASTLTLWTSGDETALGVVLREREGPGPSLCDSVTTWYDRAFDDDESVDTAGDERLARRGGYQSAVVTCAGDEVRLATAADLATARAVAD